MSEAVVFLPFQHCHILIAGKATFFTEQESVILSYLIRHRDRACTLDELGAALFPGKRGESWQWSITNRLRLIRRALENTPLFIKSHYAKTGFGLFGRSRVI